MVDAEQAFKQICAQTWKVDVEGTPPPFVCGTEFKIEQKSGKDWRTAWDLKIKFKGTNHYVTPRLQFARHVVDLGGLVYVSLAFSQKLGHLHRMTMSFDCRHLSTERWAIYFESTKLTLPGFLESFDDNTDLDAHEEKLLHASAKGSGRPD